MAVAAGGSGEGKTDGGRAGEGGGTKANAAGMRGADKPERDAGMSGSIDAGGSDRSSSSPTAGAGGAKSDSMSAGGAPAACAPAPEVCDDKDNDCDGNVDEQVTKPCGMAVGICTMGTLACHDGVWDDEKTQCQGAVMPMAAEVCDQGKLDENCNGVVNEGCSCQDGERMECGKSTAPCKVGHVVCANGMWPTECPDDVEGSAEVCDGVDNDCNGMADDEGDALCQGGKKCAGTLKCVECMDDGDCSGRTASTCKAWSCNTSSHTCQQKTVEAGTACGGSNKCTAAGSCVRCLDSSDCGSGQQCVSNECTKKAVCGDGALDSGEQCDDGNSSDNDSCTSTCKLNVCGDGHWNMNGPRPEECDRGDRSNLADGRVWDTWSCDTSCRRQYGYTPCSQDSDCGPSGACDANGGHVCKTMCSGSGSTCIPANGKLGYCATAFCVVTCTPGAAADCPPNSTCMQTGRDGTSTFSECVSH
jgi:cysteine-rich repeat protein